MSRKLEELIERLVLAESAKYPASSDAKPLRVVPIPNASGEVMLWPEKTYDGEIYYFWEGSVMDFPPEAQQGLNDEMEYRFEFVPPSDPGNRVWYVEISRRSLANGGNWELIGDGIDTDVGKALEIARKNSGEPGFFS